MPSASAARWPTRFLAAAGNSLKDSKLEQEQLPLARTLLEQARDRGVRFVLPTDVVVARERGRDRG